MTKSQVGKGATDLICKARVPSIRALSYLVMYGVVVLTALGCDGPPLCTHERKMSPRAVQKALSLEVRRTLAAARSLQSR